MTFWLALSICCGSLQAVPFHSIYRMAIRHAMRHPNDAVPNLMALHGNSNHCEFAVNFVFNPYTALVSSFDRNTATAVVPEMPPSNRVEDFWLNWSQALTGGEWDVLKEFRSKSEMQGIANLWVIFTWGYELGHAIDASYPVVARTAAESTDRAARFAVALLDLVREDRLIQARLCRFTELLEKLMHRQWYGDRLSSRETVDPFQEGEEIVGDEHGDGQVGDSSMPLQKDANYWAAMRRSPDSLFSEDLSGYWGPGAGGGVHYLISAGEEIMAWIPLLYIALMERPRRSLAETMADLNLPVDPGLPFIGKDYGITEGIPEKKRSPFFLMDFPNKRVGGLYWNWCDQEVLGSDGDVWHVDLYPAEGRSQLNHDPVALDSYHYKADSGVKKISRVPLGHTQVGDSLQVFGFAAKPGDSAVVIVGKKVHGKWVETLYQLDLKGGKSDDGVPADYQGTFGIPREWSRDRLLAAPHGSLWVLKFDTTTNGDLRYSLYPYRPFEQKQPPVATLVLDARMKLVDPQGFAVDDAGRLWISDGSRGRILVLEGEQLMRAAGDVRNESASAAKGASCRFWSPSDLQWQDADHLLIRDLSRVAEGFHCFRMDRFVRTLSLR